MIGAGGVATVAAFKIAKNADVFTEFMIASRRKEKCDQIVDAIHKAGINMDIKTAQVDADDVEQLKALFNDYKPELVINLALPYQDLTIMDACLACGCNYLDTANYEPKDEAHFEYSWQWAYKERFEQAGLTAILGCGFDPGVSGIYTAYAAKHHFDEIQYLDIVDCNAGNHHKAFATNFNPEINIREITQKGLYYKDGQWLETEPLEVHKALTYPNIGPRESYLMHHEELESLVKNYPTIKQARFWMTFGQQYLTYLDVIQNIGMSRIDEIEYEAPLADGSGKTAKVKIVPLQFLKAVLPNPQDLGENYVGYDDTYKRSSQFGLGSLRMGKMLEPGHVVTDEPGIYFIPALIEKWKKEGINTQYVNFPLLEKEYYDFGGIRLEDDLLITEKGCRLLGSKRLPITTEDVEKEMEQ